MEKSYFKDYNEAYKFLIDFLKGMDFNETINCLKKLNKKKQENKKLSIDEIINLRMIIREDFYEQTNKDVEGYNIISSIFTKYIKRLHKKNLINIDPHIISFRENIIDKNIANIKQLYYKYETKNNKNIEIRFYLLLYGLMMLHDLIRESGEDYFITYLSGKLDKKERKKSFDRYFKFKDIEYKGKNNRELSDFTNLRNQIAHGNYIIKDENIIIYINSNENEYIEYNCNEMVRIFNIILVKWSFILMLISLQWYIVKISGIELFSGK
jgi:hypothetical protein